MVPVDQDESQLPNTPQSRSSIAADVDDDDDMREELDRLNSAQTELQRELSMVMKRVATLQSEEKENSPDEQRAEKQNLEWTFTSSRQLERSDSGVVVVVEEDLQTPKQAFAQGFFQFLNAPEPLETQKERQEEIIKNSLKTIEAGLDDIMECQQETQHSMIHRTTQNRRMMRMEDIFKSRPNLEDEKRRQMELLKLTLDEEMVKAMSNEQATQEAIIQKKQQEVEATKRLMDQKLQELNL